MMQTPEKEPDRRAESPVPLVLPDTPVGRLIRPFVRFMEIEAASGILLFACAAIALVLRNSEGSEWFEEFWETDVSIDFAAFVVRESLRQWVGDGLMTVFFFVVGLEIKYELVSGELSDRRKAVLPAMAALGGMIVPALVYLLLEWGRPGVRGWGVPMATDIAFVVGLLKLFGSRIPAGLNVFLLTLAIVDDIGAVLVIALFYTQEIAWVALGLLAAGLAVIWIFNLIGVRRVPIYVVLGAGVWLACLKSGVHPTVAGVLLGLLTPANAWIGEQALSEVLRRSHEHLRAHGSHGLKDKPEMLRRLVVTVRESISPLERLEAMLHPWVAFGIMPLFALANAGVLLNKNALSDRAAVAVTTGLVLGKPLGVMLFSWGAVRFNLGRLPAGVAWRHLFGGSCLAGIGFTMSFFIAGLALEGIHLEAAKVGTLSGSILSAVIGSLLLVCSLRSRKSGPRPEPAGESSPSADSR
jgi:Na+:H+ antiporter, NhaA family